MKEEWVATPPTAPVGLLQFVAYLLFWNYSFLRIMEEEWVATPPTT